MKTAYCFILEKGDGGIIHAKHFIEAFKTNGNKIFPIHQEPIYLPRELRLNRILKFILAKAIWIYCNLQLLLKCIHCIITNKPDVFIFRHSLTHDHLFARYFIGLFFPILLEVNAINEIESGSTSMRTRIKLDKLAISGVDRLFVVSDPIKKFLIDRGYCQEESVSVIPNGVDERTFDPAIYEEANFDLRKKLGIHIDTFVIGFVGNFKKWHGIGNVIAAAKACQHILENHIFVIVGDGDTRKEYEREVASAGLTTVRFIGRVPHTSVPHYLSMMDVVLSLHCEEPADRKMDFHGSPLKLFEYMAMEKPVIASAVGQIRSVIQDGINGFLVKGEDSETVRDTLLKLRNQPDFSREVGRNGRTTVVNHYTWQQNASKVESLCIAINR